MTRDEPTLLDAHLDGLADALDPFRAAAPQLERWGSRLAAVLGHGGRLLVAGNGGSAAEAQHLAAELVGKLRDDRTPLSAIALCADSSAVTAISNDYGYEELFARQVRGHGRPGDVLVVLSTSGRSANLLAAVHAARETGMHTWAFTGPAPNPLAELCDEAVTCPSPDSQVVQELHLVSVHVLCEHVDRCLPAVLERRTALRGAQRHRSPLPDLVLAAMPAGAATGNGYHGNGYHGNGHGSAT
ncbi:SIS domain-containing protein [Dactylosporangium aurantiacum]|uniref:SIS domain-containing protein n=1 Tax=Dactylosporangium aurantiacum TaxID=35754 RepID=A0A9Q9IMP5_9ACTN|nr:SIS domain-containing protein [Dactylosporangium aurantiacum]MDG6103800.1 SIS domain-containing protein [Dactylosporangium aurantiacum]UWZ58994.1 SIS domain-containing protein [Dactylosporangium aurantiacum]